MPDFTHALSDDGLTLTTTVRDGDVSGTGTVSWKTVDEAKANVEAAKASAERHLAKLAAIGRSVSGGTKRKVIGPLTVGYGRTYGDFDTWLVQVGPLAIRPTGIRKEKTGERFILGVGGRRSAISVSVEKTKPVPPTPRIRREDIKVPLSNPFDQGDKVVIPADALVWDVEGKNAVAIDRKRNVTVRLATGGYFSPERVGIQPNNGRHVYGAIQAHTPYIQWTTGRTEVTPELLEANGKPVAYAEDQYDIFRQDIESGNYELRGMSL